MNKCYLLFFLALLSVSSCALFESFDTLPMFIEVESVSVNASFNQGTNRHAISDIWPSVDGQTIGVFEIPTTFPVLDDDDRTTMFYQAGIQRIGIVDDHTIYPFFDLIEIERDFEENTTIKENLVFTYKEETEIRFAESFNANHIFDKDVDTDTLTVIEIVDDDCAEGNCALITLTPENPEFAAATNSAYPDIPTDGTAVYLELEYKTEVNLSIGLQSEVNGTEFEQYFLTLTPTETWNKVYIDMAEILLASQLSTYNILIGALSLEDEPVEVRVDNIKLLHF